MINKTRQMALAVLSIALSLFAAPAQADVLLWRKVNGWSVYLESKAIDGCYAARRYDDGTYFRFGVETESKSFNIIILNRAWTSLEIGATYNVDFAFGNQTDWLIPMKAHAHPSGEKFLKFSGTEADLLSDIAENSALTISYDGNELSRLSLESSYTALTEVIDCQRVLISSDE